MVKTKEDAIKVLKDIAERKGLPGASFAAMYVLENYQDYDYNGSDRLFLAYCEEMIETITVSPEDFERLVNEIENPPEPSEAVKKAAERYRKMKNEDNQ